MSKIDVVLGLQFGDEGKGKIVDYLEPTENGYEKKDIWVLDTTGTNLLELLALDNIDVNNTVTNDIQES